MEFGLSIWVKLYLDLISLRSWVLIEQIERFIWMIGDICWIFEQNEFVFNSRAKVGFHSWRSGIFQLTDKFSIFFVVKTGKIIQRKRDQRKRMTSSRICPCNAYDGCEIGETWKQTRYPVSELDFAGDHRDTCVQRRSFAPVLKSNIFGLTGVCHGNIHCGVPFLHENSGNEYFTEKKAFEDIESWGLKFIEIEIGFSSLHVIQKHVTWRKKINYH